MLYSYDFDTGDTELWINPVDVGSTSIVDLSGTAATAIEAVAFRQGSDYTGSQVVDNLVVATTFDEALTIPEPSSFMLLGIGSIALLRRRR